MKEITTKNGNTSIHQNEQSISIKDDKIIEETGMTIGDVISVTKLGDIVTLTTIEQAAYKRTFKGLRKVKTLNKKVEINQRTQKHLDRQQ